MQHILLTSYNGLAYNKCAGKFMPNSFMRSKNLPSTNTLAYFVPASATKKQVVVTLKPDPTDDGQSRKGRFVSH